jgi:hypothetical protein
LGGIGEATLVTWCHEVGISPNAAKHDVKGWDSLLVLPRRGADVAPISPLDLEPPELTCLVQVKATRDATKSIKVKLSNWKHLATSPLPAFFLVLEVDATNKPKRAFLVHVGEVWIAAVLRRLREAGPSKRDELHSHSLALSVSPADALHALDGAALLQALRLHIGPSAHDYFTTKKRWVDTVGYGERPFEVTVTFGGPPDPDEFYEMMADFAIGQLKSMPITGYRARDVRFGVAVDVKDVEGQHLGFVELPEIPSRMQTRIEASDRNGIETVALDCKTHPAATIFPFLPPRHRKVALRADGATFVVTPPASDGESAKFSVSFHLPDPGERRPLGAAVAAAKLARLLRLGARFAIVMGEKRIDLGEAAADEQMPDGYIAYARAIENAATVMAAFGVPSETAVDCGHLADQDEELRALAAMANPRGEPVSATVAFNATDKPPMDTESAAVVTTWWATFGECALLVIPAVIGKPDWRTEGDGSPRVCVSSQLMPARLVRVLSVAEAKRLKVRPLLDAVLAQLAAEGIGLVLGPPRHTTT